PGAKIKPERSINQMAILRQPLSIEIAGAEQTINRTGAAKDFKLSGGVDPCISSPIREQHRTRRAQRHQAVLVERQSLRLPIEFLEARIEPMWKFLVYIDHGFRRLGLRSIKRIV